MLEKCIEVYPEEKRSNAEFYVADSRGFPIWSSDMITIDLVVVSFAAVPLH
jgi:hypothetical protein